MSPLRLNGSTSGYSQIDAPAAAGDQTFTLPTTGGTLDRINRAGNILQVVTGTTATTVTNSTTTYADTGLTASITPSSSSSKILVLIHQAGVFKSTGSASNACRLKLLRGSTDIALLADPAGYTGSTLEQYPGTVSAAYLDSPSTISSVSYKTQFANILAANLVSVQQGSPTSTITLLEVAA